MIAGAIEEKMVCWIGSTMIAVSASAICCPDDDTIVEVVLAYLGKLHEVSVCFSKYLLGFLTVVFGGSLERVRRLWM